MVASKHYGTGSTPTMFDFIKRQSSLAWYPTTIKPLELANKVGLGRGGAIYLHMCVYMSSHYLAGCAPTVGGCNLKMADCRPPGHYGTTGAGKDVLRHLDTAAREVKAGGEPLLVVTGDPQGTKSQKNNQYRNNIGQETMFNNS